MDPVIEELDLRMRYGQHNAGLQRAFLGFQSSLEGFALVLVDDTWMDCEVVGFPIAYK